MPEAGPPLYPALVASIGEGRDPDPDELRLLTDRLWRECFRHLIRGDGSARRALARAADVALLGQSGAIAARKVLPLVW